MASLQSMKGWRMLFIMVWKVAGELHSPKNMTSSSKSPWFIEKAAFHSSPSLRWTLLKPQWRSRVVNHSASCNLVSTSETNGVGGITGVEQHQNPSYECIKRGPAKRALATLEINMCNEGDNCR